MSEAAAVTAAPHQRKLAYGAGLLGLGLMDAYVFVVPLWAVLIGANATEVGLLVGARSVLPFLLTIHGGVLMDRYGPRRIMIAFIVVIMALAPLYPALPWFAPLMVMQLVIGLALTMQWVGAQTLIAQVSAGDTLYLGRFSFASRVGSFITPIIFGLIWDLTNPWVSFIGVAVWAAMMMGLTLLIPVPPRAPAPGPRPPLGATLRALAPKLSDYRDTFALMMIPAIALTIAACFMRNSTSGVQGSIYVVYLKEIGITGTAIGLLFGAIEGASGLGSLFAGRVAKRFPSNTLMVATTGLAIALINITPFLGGVFALLLAAQFARGLIQGIHQPVVFAIQSKAVARERQGATVALRVTANRFASIIVPPVMGLTADLAGLSASFLILGAGLLALTGALWVYARRIDRAAAGSG